MKYIKVVDIVDAIQWRGNNFDEIEEFVGKGKVKMDENGILDGEGFICYNQDYLIKDEDNENFFVISPVEFKRFFVPYA